MNDTPAQGEAFGLTRRRFLAATGGFAAVAFGVAACGDDSATPNASKTTAASSAPVAGTISWAIRDYFADQAKELVAAYKSVRPAVTVELQSLPTDEAAYIQRISTARIGNNLPDVIATAT
jgi:ABC-type glycerol-3-phosphate transport system substrate-binding protein